MNKVKRIYKYGTGDVIPEGAIYLSTQVETESFQSKDDTKIIYVLTKNAFVWHYFLVEVEQD